MKDFKAYLIDKCKLSLNTKILVAVSGGVDSTSLCYLLKSINQPFGIAHCNYQLRSDNSDEDEAFVRNLAQKLEVPFFSIRFETFKFASERKQSIQLVARDLRYEWLEKVRSENDFDCIATAHHLNDSIETVILNLTKGCGIKGLHGILPINNFIIRPLLFSTKENIRNYAFANNISFRMDESNETEKYTRNFIRHQIIPKLQDINKNFEATFEQNINRFRETEILYFEAIENIKKQLCEWKKEQLFIDILTLSEHKAAASILYEILLPFGFNNTNVTQILASINREAGKQFLSETHLAVLDRKHLIVATQEIDNQCFIIDKKNQKVAIGNQIFGLELLEKEAENFDFNQNTCFVDLDKLVFPLSIRKRKSGDTFQPFGMKGKTKKLKDFLRQEKLSMHDKNDLWILESNGKIVWIIGLRADERFKLSRNTKKVVKFAVDFNQNYY